MANRIESNSETLRRLPILLLAFVLLLGTGLAWWGTRDRRHLFGESAREPVPAAAPSAPQSIETDSAVLARGFQIEQRQCAGCHEIATRSSGPSYQEIVAFYRRHSAPSDGNPDLLSKLAAAVAHPQPGWGNFAPGPAQLNLSPDDRIAVASWMLNGFDQKKDTR